MANHLIDWTLTEHPSPTIQANAFRDQHIEPTPPGDPQPNPIDTPDDIVMLYDKALSPEAELDLVVKSIGRWLPQHPDRTCAVLVPDNQRGCKISDALQANDLPHDDMLRSTVTTREAAKALGHILRYLAAPLSGHLLSNAYRVWFQRFAAETRPTTKHSMRCTRPCLTGLRRCDKVEAYLWPRPDLDWLANYKPAQDDPADPR